MGRQFRERKLPQIFIEGVSVTRRRFGRSLTVTLVAEIKDELACRVDD